MCLSTRRHSTQSSTQTTNGTMAPLSLGSCSSHAALHTTSYVLIETTSLLQSRIGMEALRTFSADILPVANVAWIDEPIHLSAFHALLISDRRRLSLVDCVSFECMRRMGLERAFCFDPHFAEQGFQVIPAQA